MLSPYLPDSLGQAGEILFLPLPTGGSYQVNYLQIIQRFEGYINLQLYRTDSAILVLCATRVSGDWRFGPAWNVINAPVTLSQWAGGI